MCFWSNITVWTDRKHWLIDWWLIDWMAAQPILSRAGTDRPSLTRMLKSVGAESASYCGPHRLSWSWLRSPSGHSRPTDRRHWFTAECFLFVCFGFVLFARLSFCFVRLCFFSVSTAIVNIFFFLFFFGGGSNTTHTKYTLCIGLFVIIFDCSLGQEASGRTLTQDQCYFWGAIVVISHTLRPQNCVRRRFDFEN